MERRETDTRVEMCCAARAGLLLSTVNSLEALGLEIEQCVVSCFNDFGMHASCSEVSPRSERFHGYLSGAVDAGEIARGVSTVLEDSPLLIDPPSLFFRFQDAKQRALISTEEIKQTLFRNAGYGGRCV